MTYEERERIFSKDAISTAELAEVLGVSKSVASETLQQIKRKVGDRLGRQGYLHIEDYFEFFRITDRTRYSKRADEETPLVQNPPRRSVCYGGI